ncbi:hypothetical protein [Streptomyces somaliensis]|uniref:hypothetical protein n=1 Tax=Streptomyces somaliensis TaxID=78355 RepID=UPI0034E972C8
MSGAGAPPRSGDLDAALTETMRRTGASVGAFYLLAPEEDLLRLVVVGGVPVELATPWTRIPLASPIPVSDAVREDRMIWVGDQTQMVRSYPRAAVALPYQLSLAAVPVNGERQRGALLLMWSGDHPPRTTRRERSHITSSSRAAGTAAGRGGGRRPAGDRPRRAAHPGPR